MPVAAWPPALSWITRYERGWLTGDVTAGLTVGVMLIPQGMAYALLAGLPPIYGLYAATLPLLVYALLGSSRQLAVGPVAMDSLLTATGVGALATLGSEQYLSLAVALALLVGTIQLLAGVFRLGFLVDLLSRPIISGFTSAAALIIGLSQLPHLLGVDLGRSSFVPTILASAVAHFDAVHFLTMLIGLAGIGLMLALKRWWPAVPGPLVVVVVAIAGVYLAGGQAAGVRIVGEVPAGLPAFGLQVPALGDLRALLPTALTIALIGFMEGIAVAKAVNARHPEYTVVPNQELIAVGGANIASSLVGAFPVAGGFSRTAVNDQAGARTGLAAIISAAVIVLTLLFLTPLFYYLPQAVLASIIMVAVFQLIDWREAARLWRTDRPDFWMLAATFVATLTLGIQNGIAAGVALSIGVHVYRSMRPHLAVLGRIEGTTTYRNVNRFPDAREVPGLVILRFDAPLYFGNLNYFRAQLDSLLAGRTDLQAIVLNAEGIASVDSSAMYGLRGLVEAQQARGVTVRLAGVIGPVRDAMKKAGLYDTVGRENFYLDVDQAVRCAAGKGYALQSNVY